MDLGKLNLDELESWAKIVGGDGAGKANDPCNCPVALFIENVVLDLNENNILLVTGQDFLLGDQRYELPENVAEVVEGIDEVYDNENVSGNSVLAIIREIRRG